MSRASDLTLKVASQFVGGHLPHGMVLNSPVEEQLQCSQLSDHGTVREEFGGWLSFHCLNTSSLHIDA